MERGDEDQRRSNGDVHGIAKGKGNEDYGKKRQNLDGCNGQT
jgi:hypothetical protein